MHREGASVAEQIQHAAVRRALAHFQANGAHIQEQTRIHGIQQIHIKQGRTFADNSHGIFRPTDRHFHGRIFKRPAGTGQAFLDHQANRRKLLGNGIGNVATVSQQVFTKELNLVAVAELVESQSRESVGRTVHNAESLRYILQRGSLF